MDPRFESDELTLETVNDNIARLKRKIRDKTVLTLRSSIGDIKGLSGLQIYLKFRSVIMNLSDLRSLHGQ